MNKGELIEKVSSEVDISKSKSSQAVEVVFESIRSSLAKGEKVLLVGLGSFSVKQRAARTGRNPRTGETINIAAKKVPAFKAGKELKEAVA